MDAVVDPLVLATPSLSDSVLADIGRRRGSRVHFSEEKVKYLNVAIRYACLCTRDRLAHFLAQLFHESWGLYYMEEIASGEDYEGREDLGNIQRGDGRRYKGRGPIQLTGRANYRRYGALLDLDLEAEPEMASGPDVGFLVAAWYWLDHGMHALADHSSEDPEAAFRAITRTINGGYNGLEDRRAWLGAAWGALSFMDE